MAAERGQDAHTAHAWRKPSRMPCHVQAQQRACPPIFQAIKPAEQQTAVIFDRGQSIPMQPKGADPEWLPAATLSRASSEGGEANQGRCKCGEILSPRTKFSSMC